MEKYGEGQKERHGVFWELKKAYDRMPRMELHEEVRKWQRSYCKWSGSYIVLFYSTWALKALIHPFIQALFSK